ncbi:MAG: hypothetical protein DHS20C21_11520 [Gemmatimonadota bacterium]|nr:MAG: hypothetical protein DHS20C21_11520 [Gemmatimonadota bacterium]
MSALAFRPRKSRKNVSLDVTPLIDVLFLLIIFFTLTSTFKRAGELELSLPESSTATPTAGEDDHLVELVVMEDEGLLLDGERLERAQLRDRLLAARQEDPQGRIVIQAEASVDHGTVVDLLDLVRDVGFPGVTVGTHLAPEVH